MTGGEAVARALAAAGVDLVFGIPGTHTLAIHRWLGACGIRHVTPRHEQGGGYAADGYARVSGRAGVVLATSGPGVINAATPAATAYADSVPMLIVSPGMPTDIEGRDTGFLHESKDQSAAMDALTAYSYRARTPAEAADAVRRAFESFAAGRPRPVHVEVPVDVLEADEPVVVEPPVVQPVPEPAVRQIAAALADARRPALVLGGGARGADAARLRVPALTTVNGKGIVDERSELSLGASIRLRAAQRWLAERDLVIAVGTELGDSDLWGGRLELSGRLARIDIDPRQLHKNAPADLTLCADAAAALAALEPWGGEPEDLTAARAAVREEALRDGAPHLELVRALDEVLGPDGVLAADSAMPAYYGAVHFLPMDGRRRFIYPTGYATLGYAVPAAIGARLAAPDRPVVALCGDGGLLFTVAELAVAAELGLPLPVVVANNRGYGEIRDQMEAAGIEPVGVDLRVPDLPRLGEAFGGAGIRVDDPSGLAPALVEALGRPGPTIIEVPF
jgi:acetolactate synthase-1/2/3 large subunit